MVLLVTVALLFNGAVNMALSYREALASASEVQREKAQAASERVIQFFDGIETQMGWTTRAEWARATLEQRRYDFIRLLRQSPPITDVIQIDGTGKERLRYSRLEPDAVDSGQDFSTDPRFAEAVAKKIWYGPVTFRRGSEPYMTLSMAHAGRNPGVTSASVNLKLIWDVVSSIRVGDTGYAFVTDETGKLVSHPDMSLVLRGSDVSARPQVAAALAGRDDGVGIQVAGLEGGQGLASQVLSTHVRVPRLGWIVFVEMPLREVLNPVLVSLSQTALLLALGVLMAIVFGSLLAGRLVVPIKQLQAGALRLGEGDLTQRIPVTSKDEIGTLAVRFNDMAGRIQEAQETLEGKVEARTQALKQSLEDLSAAQDRLVQTEKLASLGQLTAGIAHEIKNPLNFVNNFAELSTELVQELRERVDEAGTSLPAEKRAELDEVADLISGNLQRIVQHGKRADSIVRNMLLHSRGGGGEARSVEINGLVEEALNLAFHGARAEHPSFNVALERRYDPQAGMATVLPQDLTRVLLNLIGNAFQATEKRAAEMPGHVPQVTVSTRARDKRVRIKVRDNGGGIPQDIRGRIFEPFFTTKPAGQGTGLGLSISHDIVVKQHGGKIEVFSEPGQFTEFVVTIPREAPHKGPPA
ncbi:ATP-binding protein [uncultured Alsobacter sp.]|uniref:sensor histidine kinase n=1 Tax=uncultured Alsobacter sp. TaxID=1748258 RepID=UPI0025EE8AE2|nr:ATP-binding protein [uncultured Alsobacter sp.]